MAADAAFHSVMAADRMSRIVFRESKMALDIEDIVDC